MTVPSREEATRLLLSLDPPEWHVRHSRAVAEIAGWLALRIERRAASASMPPGPRRRSAGGGPRLGRRLVEAAALLHDVDKTLPRDHRPSGQHGTAGASWLASLGHPELAEAITLHPVTLLVDEDGAARVLTASLEARIVAYADKRAGQRLQPMAARFARWCRRRPHSRGRGGWRPEIADRAWQRACELERAVCELAACRPDEVRRLRWTGAALRRAAG